MSVYTRTYTPPPPHYVVCMGNDDACFTMQVAHWSGMFFLYNEQHQ